MIIISSTQLQQSKYFAKRKKWLRRDFRNISSVNLLKFGTPLLILLLWEFLSFQGLISPTVLPAPTVIGATLFDLFWTGEIFVHIGVSFWRIIQGFAIGSFFGIIIGLLIGLNKKMEHALSLIIGLLKPIPNMAWVPVLILWMGIDEASKITVIAIASFWPVLINVSDGIKRTDKRYVEVAEVLEKSKKVLILQVILPSALPSIFTGLRVGMDLAWRSVVGAELIAASAGIGYMMSYARELSQTDVMLASVLCIGLVGLLLDALLKWIQAKLIRWN